MGLNSIDRQASLLLEFSLRCTCSDRDAGLSKLLQNRVVVIAQFLPNHDA